ncbi:MAG: hypothetical protein JO276_17885 [Sphingomonadaceae bacterium]|nr:hypothetical protein [Sphingomonadaceae bacterium]
MSRLLRQSGDAAASLGSFVLAHGNAGFRARGSDAPSNDAGPITAAQERARLQEEAFALGVEEGRKTAEAEYAAERAAIARLAESLPVLRPEPANTLALLLAETVDRLVRQVIGEVEIDAQTLIARAQAAAALVAKEVEPTRLRAHPDDIACLQAAKLDVVLQPDPALGRGAIVLETGHGWIEDGPAVRLDRLRAELDKMAAPR